jgi:MFS family permease
MTEKCHRGIVNTFGAFQTFYESDLLKSSSPSAISWIGSLQGFLILNIGVLTGPIFDMGYFKSLISVGSFMVVFGMLMTSISTKYYQIFLAQGVCVGIGGGFLFIPSVAIIAMYFHKKRSFAIGLAASGSSIGENYHFRQIFSPNSLPKGGVIYPIIFHQLQPRIGFSWATRVIAFVALGTLLTCVAIMKRRFSPPARRRLLELEAWKEPPYSLFALGGFLGFMGLYIPFFYISPFAIGKTGATGDLPFYYVSILNASSTFGRIIPNFVADKVGPFNVLISCMLGAGILAFCWITVHDLGGLVIFAILYGFFSGAFVSLPPSAGVSLSSNLNSVGTRLGMVFCVAGLGILIGSPIGGAILNIGKMDFLRAQIFCGVTLILGTFAMILARIAKVGTSFRAYA